MYVYDKTLVCKVYIEAVKRNEQTVKEESHMQPFFLELSGGRRIAYHLSDGKLPCVVFMGGFRSDMTGTKATTIEALCKKRGQRFLRFDYTGHGQSSGDFMEGSIGQWARDAIDVLEQLVKEPCILVGSSMGGWLMLLAALQRKEQVLGLVGIASAPDFTQSLIDHELNEAQRQEVMERGVVYIPSCYGEAPFPITRKLIEDGRSHLLLESPIPLDIPVRLIHGLCDNDVPWQVSQTIMERLASGDVTLRLVKNGGHRLSEPDQLAMICEAVEEVLLLA
jgi:pimeloyl-ACP methyl ester carboxylesterase